ncbi:hypothetical protein HY490_01535 [Candidatus Woesearchaeota archaeon]|nr:hypothetical protein [Candidatus Woesearchaeota archaeon]
MTENDLAGVDLDHYVVFRPAGLDDNINNVNSNDNFNNYGRARGIASLRGRLGQIFMKTFSNMF